MTPQSIITAAREVLQDTEEPYRNSDPTLLKHINHGISEMSIIQPPLFSTKIQHTCVVGVEQQLPADSVLAIFEVLGIANGPAVHPFDFDIMNAYNRGWRTETQAPAEQWAKLTNDPRRFYVYPPSPPDQVLDVRVAKVPAQITSLTQQITEIPEVYESALVDYVVSRAEGKDDEHVLSERSAASYASFVSKVKG